MEILLERRTGDPLMALYREIDLALPRRRPLAESIRLHRLIFLHLRDGPAVGAKDGGKPGNPASAVCLW